MKKILFAFSAGLLLIAAATGCLKNDEPKPCVSKTTEQELPAMTKFATDSSITTTSDASGLLYEIIDPGTGAAPTATSTVVAKYMGRFLNGKGFDSSYVHSPAGAEFPLNGVIRGWTIGIPKIKEGGKIKLIIPSSLAYGCNGSINPYTGAYVIPPDQPLYFYVELLSVK